MVMPRNNLNVNDLTVYNFKFGILDSFKYLEVRLS